MFTMERSSFVTLRNLRICSEDFVSLRKSCQITQNAGPDVKPVPQNNACSDYRFDGETSLHELYVCSGIITCDLQAGRACRVPLTSPPLECRGRYQTTNPSNRFVFTTSLESKDILTSLHLVAEASTRRLTTQMFRLNRLSPEWFHFVHVLGRLPPKVSDVGWSEKKEVHTDTDIAPTAHQQLTHPNLCG